jgi:hypothetical protein
MDLENFENDIFGDFKTQTLTTKKIPNKKKIKRCF